LGPALGGGVVALYRIVPYFAFGGSFSYSRTSGVTRSGALDGTLVAGGAAGRVYFYEEGVFDPYLELVLGFGSLTTTLVPTERARSADSAFGPMARVGGGLDFVVLPALTVGGAVAFGELVFERGEHCATGACDIGDPTSGAMAGAFVFGLHAK